MDRALSHYLGRVRMQRSPMDSDVLGPSQCAHFVFSAHRFHSLLPQTGGKLGGRRLTTSHCTAKPPEMN